MAVMRHARRRLAGITRISGIAGIGTAALVAGLVSALPAQAAAGPEGRIQYAGAPGTIANSYIVTLHPDAAKSGSAEGRALAKEYGADDRAYVQEGAERLRRRGHRGRGEEVRRRPGRRLRRPEPRLLHRGDPAQPALLGPRPHRPGGPPAQPELHLRDTAGEGVTAYVIDTGVRITHSDFGGRASYGYDAVDNDNTAQDGHGHGTHVAGTVAGTAYGVAKKAKVVGVRVLNNSGSGTTAQVVAGIDWVTTNAVKPAVANMSLGGTVDTAIDTAVRNSIASGVTYAVAAGNETTNASTRSPARVTEAITVGATTSTDAKASYSNYGTVLDLFAPGSSITSAWGTGDSATNTISGTSMATPHVAGAAALHLADNPTATPAAVQTALVNSATTGVVTSPGTGSPNRLLNVGGGTTPPPTGDLFENTADYAIADNSTVNSPVTVSGVTGNAPAALSVPVNIVHTYIGDLRVQLIAPDGTAYTLKAYGTGGSTDNINTTYTVNASSEAANGTWTLRVSDNASLDTGYINSWGLQF